jgi:glycosyltransferase involved in cell wall biosynthesis
VPVRFTVIVPTHNRREQLLMAIDTALEQTRAPLELLVVADGCTDRSVEAVRELGDERVQVLDMPKGPGRGWPHRNEALRRARGDAIAYLSDDDMWLPDHLERVGEQLDTGAVDLVQATACLVHTNGTLQAWAQDWRIPRIRELAVSGRRHRTPMSAVSHRRGLAEEAGGWPAAPPSGMGDKDLWGRMLVRDPRLAHLPSPTVLFFPAFEGTRDDQPARARELFARIRDPAGLASLQSEIARALHAEASAREEELDALRAEVELLRERAMTLERVTAGGWWRLRGRLLPLLRLAGGLRRALSRRAGTSRT